MTADPHAIVLDAFFEIMGEPAPRGLDTVPDDVVMWTSLTHVHLIHEIETRFGVTLPEPFLVHDGPLKDLVETLRTASG
jgi:acyl carrier protein